jgi:macrolide transport system ATP-binding/permease protein
MGTTWLSLENVGRRFASPAGSVEVLRQITLQIEAGEMLAIVGASGSGKSTLMNILGCLDRPSSGCYRVDGLDVAAMSRDQLAALRREHFGFVFQRYHLLAHLAAVDNVAMPAVYAGLGLLARRERAAALLARLGLGAHLQQRSNQLSGGQQQRVSIARALMNGGAVILADEPTGALDSHSGQEVMAILRELNQAGHTVIIVTHDHQVAAAADRVIELHDGELVADSGRALPLPVPALQAREVPPSVVWGRFLDALKMALFALRANRLRSVLTMLGIVIGIASVVSIVALGEGAREAVLKDIRAIGTNTIMVYRGRDWSDDKADSIRTLLPRDLTVLAADPNVDSVTPVTARAMRLRWKNADLDAQAQGAGVDIFRVMGRSFERGRGFSATDLKSQAQVVVLDQNARRKLFGTRRDVLGEVVLIGSMPAQVIGVLSAESNNSWSGNQVRVWLPYTTTASRLFGQAHFDQITIRVREGRPMELVEKQLTRLLVLQHGSKDFFTNNLDSVFKSMNSITRTLSLLLSLVAVISLLVGGIGVMNIMLVSVAERTREIGIRMAVGARQRDVLLQFLIEAVLVCLAGGTLGVCLALGSGVIFSRFVESFKMIFSPGAILLALVCSVLIGVLFGFMPARNAARLDPVDALARE